MRILNRTSITLCLSVGMDGAEGPTIYAELESGKDSSDFPDENCVVIGEVMKYEQLPE